MTIYILKDYTYGHIVGYYSTVEKIFKDMGEITSIRHRGFTFNYCWETTKCKVLMEKCFFECSFSFENDLRYYTIEKVKVK